MLIECPECKKQISDKADVCINCGFPLKKMNKDDICTINGKELDMAEIYKIASELLDDNSNRLDLYNKAKVILKSHTNLSPNGWVDFMNMIFRGERPTQFTGETQEEFDRKHPKCPTCGSTNISRISGTERAASVLGLGIMSKKINKTFKCNNPKCKYTW